MGSNGELSLLCRIGTRSVALPLPRVVETMRPVPVEPLVGSPDYVLGLAVVRGEMIPVVDAGYLLAGERSRSTRFVTLQVGDRQVALAVAGVEGIHAIPADTAKALPPLLRDCYPEVVAAIGTLDSELLIVLGDGRLVPDDVFAKVDARALAS